MPVGDDETLQRLARGLAKGVVAKTVNSLWLKDTGVAEVSVVPSGYHGATDALIFEADVHVRFHMKLSFTDVSREREGYGILRGAPAYSGHLVPPLFEDESSGPGPGGTAVMLFPKLNADTIADLLLSNDPDSESIVEIYQDFVDTSFEVWGQTRSDVTANVRSQYRRRVRDRVGDLAEAVGVSSLVGMTVVINGESHGLLTDAIARFDTAVDDLPNVRTCVAHGDENDTNVMVGKIAVDDRLADKWVLIDYASASGEADWIISVAKMMQTWEFDIALRFPDIDTVLEASWALDGNTLVLNYNRESLDAILRDVRLSLRQYVMEAAQAFAEGSGDTETWRQRLSIAAFAVAFGSACLRAKNESSVLPVMLDFIFGLDLSA